MHTTLQSRRTRSRARLITAAVAAVAVVLAPALSSGAAAETTSTVNIDLAGDWKFQLGDDPSWSDPGFDDSAWSTLQVPEVDGAPQFADYDGFGWYRLTFDLPASADGTNLVASLGFIDDVDEAYLNGVKIGGSGLMPPEPKSQWFQQRLYPVPAAAPLFGQSNTLAVRVYDMSGGGGWYQGPIGLFSKDAVRDTVYGISGPLADTATTEWATALLGEQSAALAAGDVDAYLDTLAGDYFHDGRDRDRRAAELRSWVDDSGSLTLVDAGVEVVESTDGRLIVDTNRSITGTKDGVNFDFLPNVQEFLTIDRASRTELGNQSRFFRDFVESELEDARREYVTYLPPSYLEDGNREYPVVYLLHGVNGGSREWEPRDFGTRLDELYAAGGLEESIVIMPDAASLWYVDNEGGTPWRSMFIDELIPQVDAEYRTLASREFRGLSGVSMGGFGAYSIGLAHPELFSSLASHMGALNIPPAAVGITSPGGPDGQSQAPIADASAMSTDELSQYEFFFDACEFDDYAFDNAVRSLEGILTAKGVDYTSAIYPEGRHNDDCWVPRIGDSFGLHSDHVREVLAADVTAPTASATLDARARTVTISATDDAGIGSLEYSLNRANGSFASYDGPIAIGERAVTVYFRAVDVAGNTGKVEKVRYLPTKARR
ncbi:MAG: beta galactosidase jelly roll domain-containing protein [Microbacteriaceae bacterium]|nr:beta galactosidase jelly roll domain-containing protein [Microbacteriaceae bacterium]